MTFAERLAREIQDLIIAGWQPPEPCAEPCQHAYCSANRGRQ